MSAENVAKKQGAVKAAPKKHHCPCGKVARAVQVMPGRSIRFECEAGHRNERKHVTLR